MRSYGECILLVVDLSCLLYDLLSSLVLSYTILLSKKDPICDFRIEEVLLIALLDHNVLLLGKVAAVDRITVLNR